MKDPTEIYLDFSIRPDGFFLSSTIFVNLKVDGVLSRDNRTQFHWDTVGHGVNGY